MDTQEPIVSRDTTFDETFCSFPTAELSFENRESTNVAGPEGKVEEEVDSSIDLFPEQIDDQNSGTVQNSYPVMDIEGEFEDAQERPSSGTVSAFAAEAAPPLRRSARVGKPPVRYGINLVLQDFVTKKLPISFKPATSPDNIEEL